MDFIWIRSLRINLQYIHNKTETVPGAILYSRFVAARMSKKLIYFFIESAPTLQPQFGLGRIFFPIHDCAFHFDVAFLVPTEIETCLSTVIPLQRSVLGRSWQCLNF
jgi:hypothetical protein